MTRDLILKGLGSRREQTPYTIKPIQLMLNRNFYTVKWGPMEKENTKSAWAIRKR